jgi:hypothetical protein
MNIHDIPKKLEERASGREEGDELAEERNVIELCCHMQATNFFGK